MTGLRPDVNYQNAPAGVRQIHQGWFGTVSWADMNQSEPYPQDHVEIAEALAGFPVLDRLEALICLHPEYDIELLEHLVHLELVRRSVKRFLK